MLNKEQQKLRYSGAKVGINVFRRKIKKKKMIFKKSSRRVSCIIDRLRSKENINSPTRRYC